jgi:hypothetical protein
MVQQGGVTTTKSSVQESSALNVDKAKTVGMHPKPRPSFSAYPSFVRVRED